LRAFLPAIGFAIISGLLVLYSFMAPPAQGEMAIVFPPMTDELTAWSLVQQAGGSIVGPTRLSNIVVAYSPDPQFQQRLRDLGAWFFLAASGLCAPATSPDRQTT
jgi:hypothetical protein